MKKSLKSSKLVIALVAFSLVSGVAVGQQGGDIDWGNVKQVWNTLTQAEKDSYMAILAANPSSGGPGRATALGRVLTPSSLDRTPGDTCGVATNELSALPFTDAGATTGSANDYDVLGSVTCNTGFDSNGADIAYRVQVDTDCDVTVTETLGLYDVVLWAVTDCANPDNTCVGSSDGGNPENFTFTATAGTDYFVLVDGWNGQDGGYSLDLTEATANGCALIPVELTSFEVE